MGFSGRLLIFKWLGTLYLAYLSFLCFNAARSTVLNFSTDVNNLSDQAEDKHNKIKSLVLGLQSSLLNPKNIMFYSSLMLLIRKHPANTALPSDPISLNLVPT